MKRGITIILAAVMALGLGLGALSVAKNAQGTKEFISDGYILDPSDEEYVTDNVDTQYYFSAGAKYKEKYGSQIVFKSSTGDNQTIDSQHFIHYNDGSLGAFTKGVLMDVSEINDSNYGYYSLTQNTVLIKNGNSYEMTSRGEAMNITEFIWKISDTDYMLVSPNITLNIGGNDVNFSDYVQLTYVDNGIVRLTHQSGTYQTVAADSKLATQNGIELNLVGKEFIVDGEPVFSLDDMAIDDDSYIDVDENITDQPTIPTFNVINGKDGANGTDGTDGEQGIEGEEGKEGEQGSEGDEGAEGTSGTAGGSGGDGVEGDTGIMGYDGAEGLNGKDAENAASASTIVSADLKARPTITVDSGSDPYNPSSSASNYSVSSGSAQMTLELDDSDNSLISGSTLVKLYNKKTMQLMAQTATQTEQSNLGATLETGSAVFNFTGLTADTEYLLVVEGEYEVEDGQNQSGVLFQKVFRTEPVGIAIAKDHVTDTEIAAITKVNGQVDSYSVVFYYYDDNQVEQKIAAFAGTSTGATYLVNDGNPAIGSNERPNTFTDVKSNTTYYAKLANVVSNGQLVNTDGSEVELKTLKETPYDYVAAHAASPSIIPVPEMTPSLAKDDKTHSLTVNLNALVDNDQGITGYRVELYKSSDISSALQTVNGLDGLVPTYTKEMNELTGCTFSIPDTDNSEYRAKVVVFFNDNEKDTELSTILSAPVALSASAQSLTVEFVDVVAAADKITGKLKISENLLDMNKTQVCGHISGTTPLKIELSGEFADTYTISITDQSDSRIDKSNGSYWLIDFEQDGLHQKSWYSLRAIGPQDTDGNFHIEGAEATTYLAGKRANTGTHQVLALASKRKANATKAFEFSINVAPTSTDPNTVAEASYTASTMDSLVLTLSHYDGVKEKTLGNPLTIYDGDIRTHDSQFKDYAMQPYDNLEENPDAALSSQPAGTKGLVLKSTATDNSPFTVTPKNFGIDDNDAALYAGGIYKITVTGAKDYTGNPSFQNGAGGNDIEFKDGQNVIMFGIDKAHVRANDPNRAVSVTPLTNASAKNGYEEPGVADDTVVGLRFRAEYGYADITEILYYIYELGDLAASDITDSDLEHSIAGDFISAGGQNGYLMNVVSESQYDITASLKCQLKLIGKHVRSGNDYTVSDAEIYFRGTQCPDDYVMSWTLADGSTSAAGQDILERGKRYIIAYRVFADHEVTPHGLTVDHYYPDCVYDGTNAPLYRSPVINLEKQTPMVERYPLSSDNDSDVWNYRIIDPDEALVVSGNTATLAVKKAASYDAVDAATPTNVSMPNVSSYTTGSFASFDLGTFTNGQFYSVGIPYKLLYAESAATEYITSKPVQHFSNQTVSESNLYVKGIGATANDPAYDKYSNTELKPIINEGNYRYRITVQGSDLDKIAALRIVATCPDLSQSVIYDPVYIIDYNTNPYGYAYIDQGPLAGFAGHNVVFSVSGYYSTKSSGFSGFTSTFADYSGNTYYVDSSNKENIFAIRMTDGTNGSTSYNKRADGNWQATHSTGATVLGSLIVPGASAGDGLIVTTVGGDASTAALNARFYADPFVLSNEVDQIVKNGIALDETGAHVSNEYYTVEKLEKVGFDLGISNGTNTDTKTYTIKQSEVVAAIKLDNYTSGAKTASFDMLLVGNPTSKIYAKVIDIENSNTVKKISKHIEGVNNEIIYFMLDDSAADYDTDDFKNNTYIAVDNNGTPGKASFKLRNLTQNNRYAVVFFVYDADGNERSLYSIDYSQVNAQYQFKTLANISITLSGPTFTYRKYDDKVATFRFGIPGNDGFGMLVNYKIVAGSQTTTAAVDAAPALGSGQIGRQGQGSYLYYSDRPEQNDPFTASFNPGSGPLYLGGTYTVRLQAVNESNPSEVLGEKIQTFYMPGSLDDPSFNIQLTAAGANLVTTVITTDVQKSIAGGYKVELFDASDTTTPIKDPVNVSLNSNFVTNVTNVVTFEGIPAGSYLVRVTADVDSNNDGTAEKQVIAESMSNAGTAATAAWGGSATTDVLELNLTNLSNFASVRKMKITVYDSNTVPVLPGGSLTESVTSAEAAGTSLMKQIDWHAASINADEWYSIKIQFLSETDVLLGELQATVKPVEVNP